MGGDADVAGTVLVSILAVLVLVGGAGLLRPLLHATVLPRTWDFFLSYKSENSNEVRRVAERLIASGHRVWFTEYEILLRNYDDFEPHIRRGIRHSSWVVLFTTDLYATSQHCRNEVEWSKARFHDDPSRIIQVRLGGPNDVSATLGLPDESLVIDASLPKRACDRDGEIDRLIEQLAASTGLRMGAREEGLDSDEPTPVFHARCAPISFKHPGFLLREWNPHSDDGTDVAYFVHSNIPKFNFNVYFHYNPQMAPGRVFTTVVDPQDSRTQYDELRAYARFFMRLVFFLRERGLHLTWIEDRVHLGLTHSVLWVCMRKYSVILDDLPRPIQVIFTFARSGTLADFCAVTPAIDQIVESVRVEN